MGPVHLRTQNLTYTRNLGFVSLRRFAVVVPHFLSRVEKRMMHKNVMFTGLEIYMPDLRDNMRHFVHIIVIWLARITGRLIEIEGQPKID